MKRQYAGLTIGLLLAAPVLADAKLNHNSVDTVYRPYVQEYEWEIESRGIYQFDDRAQEDGLYRQKLGLGRALSDRLLVEGYLLGEQLPGQGFAIEAWEVEARWQLSEQGEYAFDWGWLLEYERERDADIEEIATGVLVARDFGRSSLTLNLLVAYEYGRDIDNEFETELALQWRYRHHPALEPALELYVDEWTRAAGPVLLGQARLAGASALGWEFGLLFGLNDHSADQTLRLALEYEF